MEIKFTTSDFNERNAPITAKVMRALADAASPKPRIELKDALSSMPPDVLENVVKETMESLGWEKIRSAHQTLAQ